MFTGLTPIGKVETAEQLQPYYKKIMKLLAEEEYKKVNGLLITLPLKEASAILIMGLARLTYGRKSHLPYWDTYVSKVHRELEGRVNNVNEVMQGLI